MEIPSGINAKPLKKQFASRKATSAELSEAIPHWNGKTSMTGNKWRILFYFFMKIRSCVYALKNKEQRFIVLVLTYAFSVEMAIHIILHCKISIKNVTQNSILIVITISLIILTCRIVKNFFILQEINRQIDLLLKLLRFMG